MFFIVLIFILFLVFIFISLKKENLRKYNRLYLPLQLSSGALFSLISILFNEPKDLLNIYSIFIPIILGLFLSSILYFIIIFLEINKKSKENNIQTIKNDFLKFQENIFNELNKIQSNIEFVRKEFLGKVISSAIYMSKIQKLHNEIYRKNDEIMKSMEDVKKDFTHLSLKINQVMSLNNKNDIVFILNSLTDYYDKKLSDNQNFSIEHQAEFKRFYQSFYSIMKQIYEENRKENESLSKNINKRIEEINDDFIEYIEEQSETNKNLLAIIDLMEEQLNRKTGSELF